jgi:hypothetical protein
LFSKIYQAQQDHPRPYRYGRPVKTGHAPKPFWVPPDLTLFEFLEAVVGVQQKPQKILQDQKDDEQTQHEQFYPPKTPAGEPKGQMEEQQKDGHHPNVVFGQVFSIADYPFQRPLQFPFFARQFFSVAKFSLYGNFQLGVKNRQNQKINDESWPEHHLFPKLSKLTGAYKSCSGLKLWAIQARAPSASEPPER